MRPYCPIILITFSLLTGCALLPPDPAEGPNDLSGSPNRGPAQTSDGGSSSWFPGLLGDSPPDPTPTEDIEKLRQTRVHEALGNRDVIPGMSTEEVLRAWGTPRDIETAGEPGTGNQRWVYYTGLSSPWSTSPARVLYFENGTLAGWETVQR